MQTGSRVAPRQSYSSKHPKRLLAEEKTTVHHYRYALRFLLEIAAAGLAVYLLFGVVFGVAIIDGDSMSPNIPGNSLIFLLRLDHNPNIGDVVIVSAASDKKYIIKRVVAKSGDTVALDSNTKTMSVNGVPETQTYAAGKTDNTDGNLTYPFTVPIESMFILGDNRGNSVDSRQLGAINLRRIVGVALLEVKLP
jgi:signal peptidase I